MRPEEQPEPEQSGKRKRCVPLPSKPYPARFISWLYLHEFFMTLRMHQRKHLLCRSGPRSKTSQYLGVTRVGPPFPATCTCRHRCCSALRLTIRMCGGSTAARGALRRMVRILQRMHACWHGHAGVPVHGQCHMHEPLARCSQCVPQRMASANAGQFLELWATGI